MTKFPTFPEFSQSSHMLLMIVEVLKRVSSRIGNRHEIPKFNQRFPNMIYTNATKKPKIPLINLRLLMTGIS